MKPKYISYLNNGDFHCPICKGDDFTLKIPPTTNEYKDNLGLSVARNYKDGTSNYGHFQQNLDLVTCDNCGYAMLFDTEID